MRPRISTFGRITRKELEQYLNENQVYGFTAKVNEDKITYSYIMMFRDNKKDPEMLYVKVSKASKLVLNSYTDRGKKFNNVDELKKYTKK